LKFKAVLCAECIDDQDKAARRRIADALGLVEDQEEADG
jgi:hypothetical protein